MSPFYQGILTAVLLTLLAAGCSDMHDQPSVKAQEAPRRSGPADAVPIQGREKAIGWGDSLSNPLTADDASKRQGEHLYTINCALCHGTSDGQPGKVGQKFTPPPPQFPQQRIKELSDADLYKRITLGFGRMPAFKNKLTPTERWQIVIFVENLE